VEHNREAAISGGGRLTVEDLGQGVDWLRDRVRLWWEVDDRAWPLGTFLASVPVQRWDDTGRLVWDVELLDAVTVLAEDAVEATYSVAAGAVVTDVVAQVITDAGEQAAVTPSAETLLAAQTWPAGTTRLRIVNDLLAAVNYFAIRSDGYGRLAAQAYRAPALRPVRYTFEPGAAAIHSAEMSREQDLYAVPNRVVLISAADGDTEALVAVATNDDPGDPLSTVGRGRTIVVVEEGVEATSQAVLDEIAVRRLLDLSSSHATVEITHAVVPLDVNDVMRVSVGGVLRTGAVQRTSVELAVGAQARTVLAEVSGG
jgi:hypothetical protein